MKKWISLILVLLLLILGMMPAVYAAPVDLQSFAIVGSGIPGVAEWDPADPAGQMTKVRDALYSYTVELEAGDEMVFKFAGNGVWYEYDFGGMDFNFEGGTSVPIRENVTLCYLGGDMNYVATHDVILTFYVDLRNAFMTGGTATMCIIEDHPPTLNGFAITGVGLPGVAEWDPADPAGQMTKVSDTLYSYTVELEAGADIVFKFTGNGVWYEYDFGHTDFNFEGGTDVPIGENVTLCYLGGDMHYVADEDVILTFYVDLSEAFIRGGTATLLLQEEPVNKRILGDLSGDGKLNMGDAAKLYAHIKGTAVITDAKVLACADVTGDGKINAGDVGRLYAALRGTRPL